MHLFQVALDELVELYNNRTNSSLPASHNLDAHDMEQILKPVSEGPSGTKTGMPENVVQNFRSPSTLHGDKDSDTFDSVRTNNVVRVFWNGKSITELKTI